MGRYRQCVPAAPSARGERARRWPRWHSSARSCVRLHLVDHRVQACGREGLARLARVGALEDAQLQPERLARDGRRAADGDGCKRARRHGAQWARRPLGTARSGHGVGPRSHLGQGHCEAPAGRVGRSKKASV
eukprot:1168894-Pleurochrysis_carterae.AAC.1